MDRAQLLEPVDLLDRIRLAQNALLGGLDKNRAHRHSLTAMVAGMLDYALATRDTSLLLRVKTIYDVGCPSFNRDIPSARDTDRREDQ